MKPRQLCVKTQQSSYFYLFLGNINAVGRSRFLRDVNVFKSYMKKAPPFFKGYVRMIERFRILLLYEYNEVEKDVPAPIYFSIPNTIHKEFLKELLKEKTEKGSAVSAWDRAPL